MEPVWINSGDLRQRIDILRKTASKSVDTFGEPQATWTTVASRWGAIEPVTGREREFWYGQQMVSDCTHLVKMRFYADPNNKQALGLTPAMALNYQGRRFEIISVLNPGERHATSIMLVQVKEVTT